MTVMQTMRRAFTGEGPWTSMNLAAGYVPDWGPWEVLREAVMNAWDADPRYEIDRMSEDLVVVTSRSEPFDWRCLTVIGAGATTLSDGSRRFREGIKMAALACSRGGGTMVIEGTTFTLAFSMRKIGDHDVLHVQHQSVTEEQKTSGATRVMISMPQIGSDQFRGRILRTREAIRLDKQLPDAMRIFHQGVWVQDIEGASLWDWSFPNVDVDRDRKMCQPWQLQWRIVQWLAEHGSESDATRIMANPECYEACAVNGNEMHLSGRFKTLLADKFRLVHGDRAVVASTEAGHNTAATEKRFRPVSVPVGLARAVMTAPEPVLSAGQVVAPAPAVAATTYELQDSFVEADAEYTTGIILAKRDPDLSTTVGTFKIRREHRAAIGRRVKS